jgi:hypothetical protein
MKQYLITPSMGKRLIGKACVGHPQIQEVLSSSTLVIIAGTTNGYAAEEILKSIGQSESFSRVGFRRGLVTPPGSEVPEIDFTGDIVIQRGEWIQGKTIFEIVDDLDTGDIVLKGANVFDSRGQAAVHIGGSKGGTILAALTAIIGRRVQLIVPVGLEKRAFEDVNVIAQRCNARDAEGPRLMPMPGEVLSEIEALKLLAGVEAHLISAGGVYGAEGAVRLGINGSQAQMETAGALIEALADEPPCRA